MKTCACGRGIADKYIMCEECAAKAKGIKIETNQNHKELITELGKINNNLYFLRRALAILLREKFYVGLKWSSDKKDFLETTEEKDCNGRN